MIYHTHKYWRLLEILPGALTWLALVAPIIGSIFAPYLVAIFIICYAIFWFFRSIFLSANLLYSYYLTKNALQENWSDKLKLINSSNKLIYLINKEQNKKKHQELLNLQTKIKILKEKNQFLNWEEVYHAIILITYKESLAVLRESIKSYAETDFPHEKIIIVFAGEERDKENALKYAKILKKEFGHHFFHFMVTIHPKNTPGEIKGKSANATFAAKEFKNFIDTQNIPYENIIISNFDADTVCHKQYFSELTYKYVTEINRTEKTYQPTHMYHNNIWDVPMFVRLVAISCTFWRMAESTNKDKYRSFSSRSTGFKSIIETNYWDPAVIPEDSRQYWTAYLIYDGRHELIPIYCPLYMDAVLSSTYLKTFKNQYAQLRRWAWGVCDFPFVTINLIKHKTIPLWKKIYCILELLKNHFFWATAPILLTFTGWLPEMLNPDYGKSVMAYYVPIITSFTLTLASVGIIVCIFISLVLVPKPIKKRSLFSQISLIVQWALTPIISIILSAIPAIDAQTRLMLGKYLEYNVTEKVRKN